MAGCRQDSAEPHIAATGADLFFLTVLLAGRLGAFCLVVVPQRIEFFGLCRAALRAGIGLDTLCGAGRLGGNNAVVPDVFAGGLDAFCLGIGVVLLAKGDGSSIGAWALW